MGADSLGGILWSAFVFEQQFFNLLAAPFAVAVATADTGYAGYLLKGRGALVNGFQYAVQFDAHADASRLESGHCFFVRFHCFRAVAGKLIRQGPFLFLEQLLVPKKRPV